MVVHEDVGGAVVAAGGEGPAALALVFVSVTPASFESFAQDVAVGGAEGGDGLADVFDSFVVGDFHAAAFEDGDVGVVGAEIFELEGFLANGEVAVHGVEVVVYGTDEVVVDGDGDVVGKESTLAGTGVVADAGLVDVLFDGGAEGGGEGVFV